MPQTTTARSSSGLAQISSIALVLIQRISSKTLDADAECSHTMRASEVPVDVGLSGSYDAFQA